MALILCKDCSEPLRDELPVCPHCGRPGLFPNVNVSVRHGEVQALRDRYVAAKNSALSKNLVPETDAFENAVRSSSKAVICKYFNETFELSYSDDIVYATFYQKVHSGLRLPGGDKWDRLRAVADTVLFGETNKVHIRFAALSIDGIGLNNYGDCSITLRDEMIGHRATVFNENSVIFMRTHKVAAENDYVVPEGYRAPWDSRHLLAVAKLGANISKTTQTSDFPALLLRTGADSESDNFVEVHIWGSLTVRSVKEIRIQKWAIPPSSAEIAAFNARLKLFGINPFYP